MAQAHPVDREGLSINFAGSDVSLFTPIDRAVEGTNLCLDKLDGDWELCLVLDYYLESEFTAEHSILVGFLDSMLIYVLKVQWQIDSGWVVAI